MEFVGRRREMDLLSSALEEAESGRSVVAMLAGEAGIGKSRLAEELAAAAKTRGFLALWGQSYEAEGTPPLWPWIQALRGLARPVSPEIEALTDLRHPAVVDRAPQSARFRLFDAIARLLRRTTSEKPLLLVLEDLHWSDAPSLLLLEFLAHELTETRALIVGTYRDVELTPGHRLTDTLGELARVRLRTVSITGLSKNDAGRLLSATPDIEPSPSLVDTVYEHTEGNPFFVTEIAALLGEEIEHGNAQSDGAFEIPDSIKAVIARRFNRLSARAQTVLATAAVIGREFEAILLRELFPEIDEDELAAAIDETIDAQVVRELASEGERYQFRHALIRHVLYEQLSPGRRMKGHRRIAETLERLYGERPASQIAHHLARDARHADAGKLLRYSRLAGSQALAAHAYDEARRHYVRAWHIKQLQPFDEEAADISFGLGCAEAGITYRWNRQAAWDHFRRAVEIYLERGDVDRAVAVATHPSVTPEGAGGVVAVVERVLEVVEEGSVDEGRLLARLGAAEYFEKGDFASGRRRLRRALSIAKRHGDDALELTALAHGLALDHYQFRWDETLTKARRAIELARHFEDPHAENYARYRISLILLCTGRPEAAKREAEVNLAEAEKLRDRGMLEDALWVSSALAQLAGDWETARSYSDRALGRYPGNAALLYTRVLLESELGQFDSARPYLERLVASSSFAPSYPLREIFSTIVGPQLARLTNTLTDLGERSVAPATSGALLPTVHRDVARALTVVRNKRREEAEELYGRLSPYGGSISGAMIVTDRVLGLLAHLLGRHDHAARHFERSLRFCRKARYAPERAWTCYEYAPVLLDKGGGAHHRKAAELLQEAGDISARLTMRPLASFVASYRERHRAKLVRKPDGLTRRELEVLQLLAAGLTNKEIAQKLFISMNTVAIHVSHILEKTDCSNRTEAANYAIRQSLT